MSGEEQLSGVLSEFARTMLTDFPIQGILDRLVQRIVDVLPITAAGVTLISPGTSPRYVAASDASALRFEELQSDIGEGPCILAYKSGEAVAVADLRHEDRFPEFTPRALEAGLVAVFTFPLRDGERQLGALDLYRDAPGLLDDGAMEAAQTLADVASAYLLNAQARDDLRESSSRSRQESLHDALTGLPNRVLLRERLEHAELRARRSGGATAVLFVDLDRFKQVNDRHGHDVGDELLVAVAQRLTGTLRPGDTLARLSGDEFVVLCEELEGPEEAEAIASRVVAALAAPFPLSRGLVGVSGSVGIAFSRQGDLLSEDVVHDADTAMYQAKRKGGARYQVMDLRERHPAAQGVDLEHDLSGAAARGELRLAYQPIVSTVGNRVVGAEALLLWDHPTRGPVPSGLLVPMIEQNGLITDIGRWALAQACTDRRLWHEARLGNWIELEAGARAIPGLPTIAVNIPAHQLMSPSFTASVCAVLVETRTPPDALTLEVTESVFIEDSDRAEVVLGDLKELGVQLALDDFGSGYSSLNFLKRFPIDTVKIDPGFVGEMLDDAASLAIVVALIDLAHTLGMRVLAQGVETAGQHAQLTALGCDQCQGSFLAPSMPLEELAVLPARVGTDRLVAG